MIKFLKSNKTFTCCFFLTIIFFISGIVFNSLVDNTTKNVIAKNINNLVNNFMREDYNIKLIIGTLFDNTLEIFFVWIFGISIVGILVGAAFYSLKAFLLGFEFISLLCNLQASNIFFVIIYLLPMILNLGIFFILLYYSINYSLVLIRVLFLKRSYNLKMITTRYIRILLFTFLCGLVTALLESLVVPKILAFLL